MSTRTHTAKDDSGESTRHPWRENVEALVVAIAVALLFKYFVLEISKIPSGSMQPTLMGNPETGVFDRVLVDKLSMRMRDPERFEIVVFKHPVENSRIMVKRLVGMPGEDLRIENGDLWTRPDADSPWQILRKPENVQETAWRTLEIADPKVSGWTKISGTGIVKASGRDLEASGPATIRFRADESSIRDRYTDGYPDALRNGVRPQVPRMAEGRNDVSDLRVRGEARLEDGVEALVCRLSEDRFTYEFRIPGPAAPADARASVEVREDDRQVARIESETALQLRAGRSAAFAFWNLDDALGLRIGDTTLALDVAAVSEQRSGIELELVGAGGTIDGLTVERDVHYIAPNRGAWEVTIPEGHYVVLGDNTQDSADSRDWRAQRWDHADGTEITGNFRDRGENPTEVTAAGGEKWTRFRDRWGEVHWFAAGEAQGGLPYRAPLVPRELIQGRAVATFWPLKPWKGVWRLGWLH